MDPQEVCWMPRSLTTCSCCAMAWQIYIFARVRNELTCFWQRPPGILSPRCSRDAPIRTQNQKLMMTNVPMHVTMSMLVLVVSLCPSLSPRSLEHMKQDLEAAKMVLTDTEMSDIGSIFSGRFF